MKQEQIDGRDRKFRFSALGVQDRFDAFIADVQTQDQVDDFETVAGEKEKDELLVSGDAKDDQGVGIFLDEMQQLRSERKAKRATRNGPDQLKT